MNRMKRTLLTLGLAACMAVPALAADKVTMKDGRVFVGQIVDSNENYVRLKVVTGSLSQEHVFWMNEVSSIERDAAGTGAPAGGGTTGGNAGTAPAGGGAAVNPQANRTVKGPNGSVIDTSTHGVIVLPLSGMVGVEFRHEEIEAVGKEADRIKAETGISPIIVLFIESGGGLVLEMDKIHDTMVEIRKRHRVVAWIKEAISAACATALHCNEIYFRTEGNAGAMTMFAGGVSVKDEELEQWLRRAGEWAEFGGRSKYIAEAMIDEVKLLSYDKDPETGEVTWHNDLSGEFDLSGPTENLSFTKTTALHSGFADGLADTEAELARLLDLPKWHEVSDYGRILHEEWNDMVETARVEIPRLDGELRIIQASAAADAKEKIHRQIYFIKELIKWWKRCPNVCEYEIGVPPKEDLERILRDLERQLAEILEQEKRNRRGGGG